MIAIIRSELLKQRTTRTTLQLLGVMGALVAVVILLHTLALPLRNLGQHTAQLEVLGRGQMMGAVFAALLGALSVTAEFRHGTIRPTLLATPRRGGVVVAKVLVSFVLGLIMGLAAAGEGLAVGGVSLLGRGIDLQLTAGDCALMLAGSGVGAGLLAAVGVGIGAALRNQVPVIVGICIWLLFVEGLLFGDIGLSAYGRLLPGALARAGSGLDQPTLLQPAPALALLVLYAIAATALGWVAMSRRDVQ